MNIAALADSDATGMVQPSLPIPTRMLNLRSAGTTVPEILAHLDDAGVEVSEWVREFLGDYAGCCRMGVNQSNELVALHAKRDLGCRKPSTRSLFDGLLRRKFVRCTVDDVFGATWTLGKLHAASNFVLFATWPLEHGGLRGMFFARRCRDGDSWKLDLELADHSDKWPVDAYVICRPAVLH